MSENPNPRGWTNGRVFVDLERVVVVRGSLVTFDDVPEAVQVHLDERERQSFIAALMFYRSGR